MVPEDDEDDLLFGVESVDDSVFPLVPDSLVDSGSFQNLRILRANFLPKMDELALTG